MGRLYDPTCIEFCAQCFLPDILYSVEKKRFGGAPGTSPVVEISQCGVLGQFETLELRVHQGELLMNKRRSASMSVACQLPGFRMQECLRFLIHT